jgi:hypothetical protein
MTTLEQAVEDHAAAMRAIVGLLREEGWHEEYAGKITVAILARLAEQKPPILLSREETAPCG